MNVKRTLTIAAIGGALAAWLAGAATSTRPAIHVPASTREPIEKSGAELASEIDRLHERLRPTAAPRQPARNLFAYRASAAAPAARPLAAPKPLAPPALLVPPLPALKLAGIAEDDAPEGAERTAFITGEGQLFMVKEGETVPPRYRVTKISSDVVELVDTVDNTIRRLALR
jgi:hypothetical protein